MGLKQTLKVPCTNCGYVWELFRMNLKEITDSGKLDCLKCHGPLVLWNGKLTYQYTPMAFVDYKLYLEQGGSGCVA